MAFEKFPNQTGQNWPVSTQYQTHPGTAVGVPVSPQYDTFPSGSAATPLTIFGADLMVWLRGDSVTLGAGPTVTQFTDLSGNGHHFAGGVAPDYVASAIDGQPGATFNGTTMYLENTSHVYPAPGTTPTFHWFIATMVTWGGSRPLINSVTGFVQEVFCNTATPQIRTFNTASTPLNNGMAVGVPTRVRTVFTNNAADHLRAGTVNQTGNAGNSSGGGGSRLGRDSGANFLNWTLCEYVRLRINPSAGQLTSLDAYGLARYPTVVF